MDRRKFIATAGSGLAMSLAGCMGFGSDDSSSEEFQLDDEKERYDIGESVEYGDLQVTLGDPVLADHYAPYDCSPPRLWEDDDAVECTPPEIDDFEEPPTQGGQFMAIQITMENVGGSEGRRISLPFESGDFDLVNNGYAENEFMIEEPWVAAEEVFPSWVFFIDEHDMNEQGVFPGVSVRGYIAFEVPIEADLDEMTGIIRWAGSEEEEQDVYWDITEDDVDDLTDSMPPEHGGDVFYQPRAGGINWGDDGHPDDEYNRDGINWEYDGDGDYHVPESQEDDDEEEEEGDDDVDGPITD